MAPPQRTQDRLRGDARRNSPLPLPHGALLLRPERSVASIVIEDGKVLAARRVHGGELGGLWEFPGGKLEEGETDADALVREFDEEFGVLLEPLYFLGETSFFHHGRKRALAAWVCRLGPDRAFRLSEHLEIRWLPCDGLEALDLVDSDRKLLPLVRDCLDGSREGSGAKI